MPQRRRGKRHVGELAGAVDTAGTAALHVGDERGERQFAFVEHKMIHLLEQGVLTGEQRPAGDDGLARRLAAGDGSAGGIALDRHAADEDAVGPGQIIVGDAS